MSDTPTSEQAISAPAAAPPPDPAPEELPTDEAPHQPDRDAELEQEDLEISDLEAQLLDDMDRLQSERNDYLDQLLRTRADFDNYRKRIVKQQSEHELRAAEALVEKLLEPMDTLDLAVSHGQGFQQARDMLANVLAKEGLERIDPVGKPFDPNEADAVAHEHGDGGPVVAEVLRPGYRWKGRVIRPAMVKVKG
ncbi:MAG: nucleotide exchange factor GrpE [Acidimicrobiales bacterium]|nr:nucleotide exchange factor GrpE [Acidimicrobiales bacterium]